MTVDVSIHAPRVGRDRCDGSRGSLLLRFNPRAPCGARPSIFARKKPLCEFQSTRPVWGATADVALRNAAMTVSIHAPRVGRDAFSPSSRASYMVSIHAPRVGRDCAGAATHDGGKFQSTRPVWGATRRAALVGLRPKVSIHAPRVGRDTHPPFDRQSERVSIHAPRVGRDDSMTSTSIRRRGFNPRAPCGARLFY